MPRIKIVEERLGNAQREYIAILGIFAAVVLAFTGGIAFSTSVLQNLHISSIYRIVLAVVIIGLVLVNLLYGLFYYIGQLVNKNAENNLKPLWIVNLVFLLILIAIIIVLAIIVLILLVICLKSRHRGAPGKRFE